MVNATIMNDGIIHEADHRQDQIVTVTSTITRIFDCRSATVMWRKFGGCSRHARMHQQIKSASLQLREAQVNYPDSERGTLRRLTLYSANLEWAGHMLQGNSLGIVTGLALVGALVIMIASFDTVARTVLGPPQTSSYELAGSSRPVTLGGGTR